jgi:hypothetical protein
LLLLLWVLHSRSCIGRTQHPLGFSTDRTQLMLCWVLHMPGSKAILGPTSAEPRVILGHAPDMTQHPIESYTRQDSKLFWVLHTSGSKAIVGSTPGKTRRYFGSCTQQDLKLYKKMESFFEIIYWKKEVYNTVFSSSIKLHIVYLSLIRDISWVCLGIVFTQNKISYKIPKIYKVYDVNQKFIESSINFNMIILENYLLNQTKS